MRRDRPRFVAVTALTIGLLAVWPVVDFGLREAGLFTPFGFNDFGAYTGALDRWATGEPIYVRNEDGSYHGSFLYPPITLVVFYPFATFGFPTGAVLLSGVSLVLLWVGLDAVTRSLGYDLLVRERLALLVVLVGFQPALRDFKWAQISTLLTALLCFAFCAHELGEHRRPAGRLTRYASGAFTTIGSAFKLFFAPAGAHLLRDRDRFVAAMATAGLLALASVAVFGIEPHRQYIDVLLWGKGWGRPIPPELWDTSAAYRPLYFLGEFGMPVRLAVLVGVVWLTLTTRDVETTTLRRAVFALGVAVIPLVAPRVDSHDLVVVVLPVVILLAIELERPRGYPAIPVLVVLLVHLQVYVVHFALHPPGWLPLGAAIGDHVAVVQPGMWATFLLVGLAAYRVGEHARWAGGPTR